MTPQPMISLLRAARLPLWGLPGDWPRTAAGPALADICIERGRLASVRPHDENTNAVAAHGQWHLAGALVLPGLVDAHTHLDKAFTLSRMGDVKPGLLGAIDAMMADRMTWTEDDIRNRATRALVWAHAAGVTHLRTHCDWWEPEATPLAWHVLRELAQAWAPRMQVDRVSLIPLHLYAQRSSAMALAAQVARGGDGACLGGFVHSTNWDPAALRHLFEAAQLHGLDVDLHVDEELNPAAQGLATTADLVAELGFEGKVVCGHTCALATQAESVALGILDRVAKAGITLVTLPITNLLLQDAVSERTPRQRGLTLVKEARQRGIPVLLASDNVQDPFCPMGSFDPLEAFSMGVPMGQLNRPFDTWSEALCRRDWLARPAAQPQAPLHAGQPADLLVFTDTDVWGFPSRHQNRVVLRKGVPLQKIDAKITLDRTSP